MGEGTLARTSILGSAPRVMVEHVREADWDPAGSDLAVVRRMGGFERLEYPIGKVLYQTSDSSVTFDSRRRESHRVTDHPVYADDAGAVAMVDLEGHLEPCQKDGSRSTALCGPEMDQRSGLVAPRVQRFQVTGSTGSRRPDVCAP